MNVCGCKITLNVECCAANGLKPLHFIANAISSFVFVVNAFSAIFALVNSFQNKNGKKNSKIQFPLAISNRNNVDCFNSSKHIMRWYYIIKLKWNKMKFDLVVFSSSSNPFIDCFSFILAWKLFIAFIIASWFGMNVWGVYVDAFAIRLLLQV